MGNLANSSGGVYMQGGVVQRCRIYENMARQDGGGVGGFAGDLANCLVMRNTAANGGGGVDAMFRLQVRHCTIVDNTASTAQGVQAGGGSVRNCIVVGNGFADEINAADVSRFQGCCATGLQAGVQGNIVALPTFWAPGDYRLAPDSPCIDAGLDESDLAQDINGLPRPLDGDADGTARGDMGAFEFLNPDADTDHDGVRDADEREATTDPLDAGSRLALTRLSLTPDGVHVEWQGGNAATQYLERCISLDGTGNLWQAVLTNVPPTATHQAATDQSPAAPRMFYRIRVLPTDGTD